MRSSNTGQQGSASGRTPGRSTPHSIHTMANTTSKYPRLATIPEHESLQNEPHHGTSPPDTTMPAETSTTPAEPNTPHDTTQPAHAPTALLSTAPSNPSIYATAPIPPSPLTPIRQDGRPSNPDPHHQPTPALPPSPPCPLHGGDCDGVTTTLSHYSEHVTTMGGGFREPVPCIVRGERTMVDWERLCEEERSKMANE